MATSTQPSTFHSQLAQRPGPLGLGGFEGFWLMVEGPLPLATSTQPSTFHSQLAQRPGPLGLKGLRDFG
jgi:hypothetical protein